MEREAPDPFARLRAEYKQAFAPPERCAELSRERFKPWPLYKPRATTGVIGVDAVSAIRPIAHLGFVSNSRFAGSTTTPVIERTNRTKTRQFRKSVERDGNREPGGAK